MIYLDFTATTATDKDIAEKMLLFLTENYGNPSSPHKMGISASNTIELARKSILNSINLNNSHKIIFTSGGSEGNSFVLSGVFEGVKNKSLIISQVEHNSIKTIAKKLSLNNVEVLSVKPDKDGEITPESVTNLITENTRLVSIMAVNNETGYVFDIENICKAVKAINKHILFHTDFVQGFMKIPMNLRQCDFISVSAHKIFGPKGTGAVFIKRDLNLPCLIGGTHEYGFRGGTQNVAGIIGMAAAVEKAFINIEENLKIAKENRKKFLKTLSMYTNNFSVIEGKTQSPYILGLVFQNIKSEVVVRMLSEKEVYISAGSACSSKSKIQSKSINTLGFNGDFYLRVSISYKIDHDSLVKGAKIIAETVNEFKLMLG